MLKSRTGCTEHCGPSICGDLQNNLSGHIHEQPSCAGLPQWSPSVPYNFSYSLCLIFCMPFKIYYLIVLLRLRQRHNNQNSNLFPICLDLNQNFVSKESYFTGQGSFKLSREAYGKWIYMAIWCFEWVHTRNLQTTCSLKIQCWRRMWMPTFKRKKSV